MSTESYIHPLPVGHKFPGDLEIVRVYNLSDEFSEYENIYTNENNPNLITTNQKLEEIDTTNTDEVNKLVFGFGQFLFEENFVQEDGTKKEGENAALFPEEDIDDIPEILATIYPDYDKYIYKIRDYNGKELSSSKFESFKESNKDTIKALHEYHKNNTDNADDNNKSPYVSDDMTRLKKNELRRMIGYVSRSEIDDEKKPFSNLYRDLKETDLYVYSYKPRITVVTDKQINKIKKQHQLAGKKRKSKKRKSKKRKSKTRNKKGKKF
tara:strand:- start:3324 stop:4124 length:801 start_codon:yes stop_codon:yes gene_type:complete